MNETGCGFLMLLRMLARFGVFSENAARIGGRLSLASYVGQGRSLIHRSKCGNDGSERIIPSVFLRQALQNPRLRDGYADSDHNCYSSYTRILIASG